MTRRIPNASFGRLRGCNLIGWFQGHRSYKNDMKYMRKSAQSAFYLYPIFDSFIAIFVFINYFGNFRSRVTLYIFPKSVFVVDHADTYFTLISFEIIDFETINKWFIARLLRNSVGFSRLCFYAGRHLEWWRH